MDSMNKIICEMEATFSLIKLRYCEGRFADMPFLLGKLTGCNKLLLSYLEEILSNTKGQNHDHH